MAQIELAFTGSSEKGFELFRISFAHSLLEKNILAVRGKLAGAYRDACTFQWTKAVRALSLLALETKLAMLHQRGDLEHAAWAVVSGETGSPASSLDYALGKEPEWLCDIFGRDQQGKPLCRRLFKRTNPDRKRPGPVAVAFNLAAWSPLTIIIRIEQDEVVAAGRLTKIADNIAEDFEQGAVKGEKGPTAIFDVNSWKENFSQVLFDEIRCMLAETDIFNPQISHKLVAAIQANESFIKVAGGSAAIVSGTDAEIQGPHRLGVVQHQELLDKHLRRSDPFTVVCPVPLAASAAIFQYLQQIKGYSFELNIAEPHAIEVTRRVVAGAFSEPPALFCNVVAGAATLLSRECQPSFTPLMLLPMISQRIVAPESSSHKPFELSSGEFMLIQDDPSVPSFMFEELVRKGYVDLQKAQASHFEPDETLLNLAAGESDVKAILFFPYYLLNEWFNRCSYIPDPRESLNNQEGVLLVRDDLAVDKEFLLALDIAVRDAWLALKTDGMALQQVIAGLLETHHYLQLAVRFSGLHNLAE